MGRVIGSMMNRYSAPINEFALRQLEIQPQDRILEIGFGGGLMLRRLISANTWVTGIDRSTEMVNRANIEFQAAVKSGRAVFDVGSVEALPYRPATFNKVSTVNTIYFWSSLESGLKEIHRVLVPGGRATIGFLPEKHMARMNMPKDIYTLHSTEKVIATARDAGFSDISVEWPDPEWNVIVAHH
jgi:ubiquinone/menaquinone biosynthesis C-methylase UbiE